MAHRKGITSRTVCGFLSISRCTFRKYVKSFNEGGCVALFAMRASVLKKSDDENTKQAVFKILHEPPSKYGINRTSWIMEDLSRILKHSGHPVGKEVIRRITREAGYKWRKARVVLTSNDPNYSDKLEKLKNILSNLKGDELFFSVDEFGPFAVKMKPGRMLMPPGEQRIVPQWQKSRGCLILTAALELSANQVSHFYSSKKDTAEMIKMLELLLDQHPDRRTLYLSWDAASWHISKQLQKKIDDHNESAALRGRPLVELVPLPAGAQFLNVIESVFSGMARAIIHNSNYTSADEAKIAIDRYFEKRNDHFKRNPKRAGNKIWGEERVPARFSDANNCKDPLYR
ncbi:IS630 family transposase [Paracoccus liaowanqingii]|uniref:IS630 family transposase n=2 Tax=Paracoccus liaowanqingii TaxID=2560053 RepID=A0A4Z1BT23_9RHOB|nr:IS630 family transposase [Paracoccus liaowanqingii]